MTSPPRQRGIVSLLTCLACATALAAAPEELSIRVRSALRSSLVPGSAARLQVVDALDAAKTSVVQFADRFRSPGQVAIEQDLSQLDAERTAAMAEVRRLQVVIAELQSQLSRTADNRLAGTSPASEPRLLQVGHVTARVIGQERGDAERTASRLIQCGAVQGIADSDLVIEPALLSEFTDQRRSALLDQGARLGIAADLPVLSGETLVGRVKAVGQLASTVQLVTDPQFRIGAQILRSTRSGPVFGAVGVYCGGEGGVGRLDFVAATEPVAVGDAVYTDEQVAGSRVRMRIGAIIRAELKPGEPHWELAVQPELTSVPPTLEVLKVDLNPARWAVEQQRDEFPSGSREPARFEPPAGAVEPLLRTAGGEP